VTEGDPKLRPGTPVNIENIAPPLAGRYVLTSVDHTFDSVRGFVSTISTAPPPLNQSGQGSVAALGIVTQIDDPEGLGRVRVKLPTYRDIETDWMGVVTSGAGKGKGLLALPDVNDTVLVLLPSGDPANGVVLGGLYGMLSKDGWDWGVDKTALKGYTLRTPDGQRIQLNDSKHSIRFENKDGSYMEMSPDTVRLHSVRDLQIDAPNVLIKADKGVVIKAQTVDFQGA
jgi:phage baseplate assembly protein gpV